MAPSPAAGWEGPADAVVLPTFLVLGAAKAGTTTLARMLDGHPEIGMPKVKEAGYFSVHADFAAGVERYSEHHFRRVADRPARGDATPSYLCSPEAPDRVLATLPPASHRFVVLLRDPVDRAYSHYLHMVRTGVEQADFATAMAEDAARVAAEEVGVYNLCYAYGSRYATHLGRWLERFPASSFLFLFFDDLRADPVGACRQVLEFVDVDPDVPLVARHDNPAGTSRFGLISRAMAAPPWMKRSWDRVLSPRTKQRLTTAIDRFDRRPLPAAGIDPARAAELRTGFERDISVVETLTGRDLTPWRRA